MRTSLAIMAGLTAVTAAITAQAAPVAYDGMNYAAPSAQVSTKTGGTGWVASSWNQTTDSEFLTSTTGGLTYGGLATQAGAITDTSATAVGGRISRQ